MAFPFMALANIGSSLIGAGSSYFAAKEAREDQLKGGRFAAAAAERAAKIQADAAREGLDIQRDMYDVARRDLSPFRRIGKNAFTTLGQLYGIPGSGGGSTEAFNKEAVEAFRRSPDYQFAFEEGQRAVNFGNAGKGQLLSGNNMRDLTRFGQGLATQNFQNYAARLLQLAGMGQNAGTVGAGQSMQFGQAAADALGNVGQARASGIVGGANAINASLGGSANNLMLYNMMQTPNFQSAYRAPFEYLANRQQQQQPQVNWTTTVNPAY